MRGLGAWAAAALLAGCMHEDVTPSRPRPRVELSSSEPGPACRLVESVEVQSGPEDLTTHESLTAHARARGANYVVLDSFAVHEDPDEPLTVTRARLFACPIAFVACASADAREGFAER